MSSFATVDTSTSSAKSMEGGVINTNFRSLGMPGTCSSAPWALCRASASIPTRFLALLWSIFVDKYVRKHVLIFITGIWELWTMGVGFARNYTQLLILYTIALEGCAEHLQMRAEAADKGITLVKNTLQQLPIHTETHKRIRLDNL